MISVEKFKFKDLFIGKKRFYGFLFFSLVVYFFIFSYSDYQEPPENFPSGKFVTIEQGSSVKQAGETLKLNNVIKSELLFTLMIKISEKHVIEGDYFFPSPLNLKEAITKVTSGKYDIPTKKITFFEGITNEQIAERLKQNLPNFKVNEFLELAKDYEGYLFPDTYIFPINVTHENVFKKLRDTFEKKIAENSEIVENSPYSLDEIVIMASIIEREADASNRQEVSNILWKRIESGIPLQVDAPFVYAIGKGTFDLTISDLRDSSNPYNTYTNKGLTPTPIANPGLESILAAANPRDTNNLFFLTGRDGIFYFATNFEKHIQNKRLYLD